MVEQSAAVLSSTTRTAVGMVHVPINTVIAAPADWRRRCGLPEPAAADWDTCVELERHLRRAAGAWVDDFPTLSTPAGTMDRIAAGGRGLSFYPALLGRAAAEIGLYRGHGFDTLMLENIAGPYFSRDGQPAAVVAVMDALAADLRAAFPDVRLGIQILAFSDNLALDVAVRHGLRFIRSESALFAGLRPEGRTPNAGNLAKLYLARNALCSRIPAAGPSPQVLVDVQKKHTVFGAELAALPVWLENVRFQKLEGVILTGAHTGTAVSESDLATARAALDRLAAVEPPWRPPLIVGSGVDEHNLAQCCRYADAVIVGSALKERGYWESPLDPERLARFADAWSRHGGL